MGDMECYIRIYIVQGLGLVVRASRNEGYPFGGPHFKQEIQVFSKLDPPVLRKPVVSHQRAPPHDGSPEFLQFYLFVKLPPGPWPHPKVRGAPPTASVSEGIL